MLLEVITRCYKRPEMLRHNIERLRQQTSQDWRQTFIVDRVGYGVGWANAQLASVEPIGDYVWVLDDDDVCIVHTLVADLAGIVKLYRPPAIMLRMDHGPLGILPPERLWRREPQNGQIGCSAIVTRADVWLQQREAWTSGKYNSDFDFITAVHAAHADEIYWHDVVASAVQRISHGQPEVA